MSSELKPCPFCGGEARIIAKPYEPKVCVGCDDDTCLGFSGLGWLYDSEKEATEAWNRRAERMCKSVSPYGFNDRSNAFNFKCSECGAFVDSDDMGYSPLVVDDECEPLRFCPNCGAKVVDE